MDVSLRARECVPPPPHALHIGPGAAHRENGSVSPTAAQTPSEARAAGHSPAMNADSSNRQSQHAEAMQLQQRDSTTDSLELAQSCAPIQPSAHHLRQNPSGKRGIFIEGLLNAFENNWDKFLTAGFPALRRIVEKASFDAGF
jgi:hypothetical protein